MYMILVLTMGTVNKAICDLLYIIMQNILVTIVGGTKWHILYAVCPAAVSNKKKSGVHILVNRKWFSFLYFPKILNNLSRSCSFTFQKKSHKGTYIILISSGVY